MDIHYTKLSPTQNMTLLVDTPVPRAQHAAVARELLRYDGVYAEQVGFIETPEDGSARARLQMMGGEFCGNASMSLGAYLLWKDGAKPGTEISVPLEVSGAPGLLRCQMKVLEHGYEGSVEMPLPEKVEKRRFYWIDEHRDCTVVFFPGIAHVLVPRYVFGQKPREMAERVIRDWAGQLKGEDAVGILLYDGESIEPLVYVPSTDSAVWERGCGSGSAAMGVFTAQSTGADASLTVRQPGGAITVHSRWDGSAVTALSITGTVRIVAEGTAFLEE